MSGACVLMSVDCFLKVLESLRVFNAGWANLLGKDCALSGLFGKQPLHKTNPS